MRNFVFLKNQDYEFKDEIENKLKFNKNTKIQNSKFKIKTLRVTL
jgi:hypothetical protein